MSMYRKRGREDDDGSCESSAGCNCSNDLCNERCRDGCSLNCPECARLENERELLAAGLAAKEANIVYLEKSCEMHKRDTQKIRHNLGSILGLLTQGDRHGLVEYRHGGAEPRREQDSEVEDRDRRDDMRHRHAGAGWRDEGRDKESGGEQSRTGAGWRNAGPSQ